MLLRDSLHKIEITNNNKLIVTTQSKERITAMTYTNRALRSATRVATAFAIRPCPPMKMIIHGSPMVCRKQQPSRNFSTPIAIDSGGNQDIATLLLVLSPPESVDSKSLQETSSIRKTSQRKSESTDQKEECGNRGFSHRQEDKEASKLKKKELSQFLS